MIWPFRKPTPDVEKIDQEVKRSRAALDEALAKLNSMLIPNDKALQRQIDKTLSGLKK